MILPTDTHAIGRACTETSSGYATSADGATSISRVDDADDGEKSEEAEAPKTKRRRPSRRRFARTRAMGDVHRVLSLSGAVVSLTGGVVGHRVEVCGVVSRRQRKNCTVTLILNDGAVRRGMRGAKLGAFVLFGFVVSSALGG